MKAKAKDPRCGFYRTHAVKWPDAPDEETRCKLPRGHAGMHECAVDARKVEPVERITSAQHKALVELAFNGLEVGRKSTFDALWKRGLLRRDGGLFHITDAGLVAIDRPGMTPAPRNAP